MLHAALKGECTISERKRAGLFWAMFVRKSDGIRYVKAEAPCWKGEIVLWRLVIGWQK